MMKKLAFCWFVLAVFATGVAHAAHSCNICFTEAFPPHILRRSQNCNSGEGQVSNNRGVADTCGIVCQTCPAGTISRNNTCQPCPQGSHSAGGTNNSTTDAALNNICTPCQAGFTTSANRTATVFGVDDDATNLLTCVPCPGSGTGHVTIIGVEHVAEWETPTISTNFLNNHCRVKRCNPNYGFEPLTTNMFPTNLPDRCTLCRPEQWSDGTVPCRDPIRMRDTSGTFTIPRNLFGILN